MKKILSLLTAITLTASGSSSVISCGSKIKTNAASKKAVDAIKAKIVKKTLSIQGGNIDADASKAINKSIIDAALTAENTVLSPDDLKYISYSGTLTPKSTKTIKATISIGSGVEKASTTIDLEITWSETNQEAANSFATSLNNKSIDFMQKGTDTKASAYVSDITTKLRDQVNGSYTFTFDGSDGNIDLTTTAKQIKIKIDVSGVSSTSSATINMKFTDNSDIVKANNFATDLNNKSIDFMQKGTDTKASDYTSEILSALKAEKSGNYNISFATSTEGDKILSKTYIAIGIKAIVNSSTSSVVATINVKFTDNSDIAKANMIATTLKNASINPIKLNINSNKQKLSDYFQSDIKALLDAQLTNTEKAYNYSLVNTQNITNTAQDFNVKIQIGSATSTVEFTINVQFAYAKISGDLETKSIYVTKKIGTGSSAKIYVGTENGLYISSDATGTSFTQVSSITNTASIYAIEEIGTGANTKIYVGTTNGLYESSDATGTSFTQVSGDLGTKNILNIQKYGTGSSAKIYVGTSGGLYVSSDATGTSFTQITSIGSRDIFNIKQIGSKIYIGTDSGLYESSNGTSFSKVSGDLSTKNIFRIQQIGTGSSAKIYVGVAGDGLWVSSDATGSSFTKVNSFPISTDIYSIQQINNIIYFGTTTGLYISNDGTIFTKATGDLGAKVIISIQKIESKIYVGTLNNGLYYNFVS